MSIQNIANRLAGVALCLLPTITLADTFPQGPVTILVPYTAGGSVDAIIRPLAQLLSEEWGQPVIVENKPGANGMIATNTLIRAKPDGHTLLHHITGIIQNPIIYKSVRYDPLTDVEPVVMIGNQAMGLAVPSTSPLQSVKDLIAENRQQGVEHAFGSTGVGHTGHIWSELLSADNQLKTVHVPYKGSVGLYTDLVTGRLNWAFVSAADAVARSQEGTLRILAVTGKNRLEGLDKVETFSEQGLPGFEMTGWHGIFAPAGTPKASVEQIAASFQKALQNDKIRELLNTQAIMTTGYGPEAFKKTVHSDYQDWQTIIQRFGISLD